MATLTHTSIRFRMMRTATLLVCATLLCIAFMSESRAQQSVESQISLERAEAVRITNIDDWTIGVFTSSDTINNLQYQWDWQCVYTSTGSFRVDVTSANGGAQLALESGSGDQMIYQIYTYSRQGNNYSLIGHNGSSFSLSNLSGSQSLTCNDEPSNTNLWFAAVVRPPAFNAAPPGIYQDIVTIMVSPE
ncbi:MAG: hypothetical protein AB8B87_08435 [Granulosicoccus sp.]